MQILEPKKTKFKLDIKCEWNEDDCWNSPRDNCGCMLRINENDIKYTEWIGWRDNERVKGADYTVECPKCHCTLTIPKNFIPQWVVDKIEKERYNEGQN